MRSLIKTLAGLAVFSIAMGYLETAVVVYLRMLYYPAGFRFPLTPIPAPVAMTEFFRELATIIMLAGIAGLAGKGRMQRFAFFLYCFGIWDIFYYVFLRLLIGWPPSLLTWDILFLIPLPWVGPVLAPCIVSLTMIGYAVTVTRARVKYPGKGIRSREGWLIAAGSLVVVASFLQNYLRYITLNQAAGSWWRPGSHVSLFSGMNGYIPGNFDWGVFWTGEGLILLAILMIRSRSRG